MPGTHQATERSAGLPGDRIGEGAGGIRENSDLFQFQAGEILVIDAIDPNSTFVAPLAAGIIERRGGMLIHGAIVAREYGIPCITGITDATSIIDTGDAVVIDGFLGIVTIEGKK